MAKKIIYTTEAQHRALVDSMRSFMDDGKPQVGIFWYDPVAESLFGVEKADAEKMPFINGRATINKLHKTYWQKQHHRAVAKGDERSIFYREHNYTLIPRGRVFYEEDSGLFYVCVGNWIYDGIDDIPVDIEQFRILLEDEFNLPEDFDLVVDTHWDLGHGWSEEVF